MGCKDCISFSRCKEMYEAFGIFIDLENSVVCKHFKNKADFEKVVRCVNCIHFEAITLDSGISVGFGNCKNEKGINLYPNETDFCSYGERKLSEIPTVCEGRDT